MCLIYTWDFCLTIDGNKVGCGESGSLHVSVGGLSGAWSGGHSDGSRIFG